MARGWGGMQKVIPDPKATAGEWTGGAERIPSASGTWKMYVCSQRHLLMCLVLLEGTLCRP